MADFTALTTGATAAMDAIRSVPDQRQPASGDKAASAAKDFEALLLGQMLKSARGDGGWLGTDGDDAGEAAVGIGEEQLARTMARSGGFGLARLVESGLRGHEDAVDPVSPAGKLPLRP
jgi:Rod binding domain-containing protein